jgi:hypothetical protein
MDKRPTDPRGTLACLFSLTAAERAAIEIVLLDDTLAHEPLYDLCLDAAEELSL